MSKIFRHYRQVKIVSQGDSIERQVKGVEEIYCNGQRQVRYWSDPEYLRTQEFADLSLFDLMSQSWGELPLFPIDESIDWMNTEYPHRSPRYIHPHEVVIEPDNTRQSAWSELLQKLQRVFAKGTRKIQKIVRNLPSALKVAWQELNQ